MQSSNHGDRYPPQTIHIDPNYNQHRPAGFIQVPPRRTQAISNGLTSVNPATLNPRMQASIPSTSNVPSPPAPRTGNDVRDSQPRRSSSDFRQSYTNTNGGPETSIRSQPGAPLVGSTSSSSSTAQPPPSHTGQQPEANVLHTGLDMHSIHQEVYRNLQPVHNSFKATWNHIIEATSFELARERTKLLRAEEEIAALKASKAHYKNAYMACKKELDKFTHENIKLQSSNKSLIQEVLAFRTEKNQRRIAQPPDAIQVPQPNNDLSPLPPPVTQNTPGTSNNPIDLTAELRRAKQIAQAIQQQQNQHQNHVLPQSIPTPPHTGHSETSQKNNTTTPQVLSMGENVVKTPPIPARGSLPSNDAEARRTVANLSAIGSGCIIPTDISSFASVVSIGPRAENSVPVSSTSPRSDASQTRNSAPASDSITTSTIAPLFLTKPTSSIGTRRTASELGSSSPPAKRKKLDDSSFAPHSGPTTSSRAVSSEKSPQIIPRPPNTLETIIKSSPSTQKIPKTDLPPQIKSNNVQSSDEPPSNKNSPPSGTSSNQTSKIMDIDTVQLAKDIAAGTVKLVLEHQDVSSDELQTGVSDEDVQQVRKAISENLRKYDETRYFCYRCHLGRTHNPSEIHTLSYFDQLILPNLVHHFETKHADWWFSHPGFIRMVSK